MASSKDCIFCSIARNEIGARKIKETGNAVAFLDVNPLAEGHTLVIPKVHYADIFEVPDKTLSEVIALSKKISFALMKAELAGGINLLSANREVADQSVFHFHIHVIPRKKDDGLSVSSWWNPVRVDEKTFDWIEEKMKQNLIG